MLRKMLMGGICHMVLVTEQGYSHVSGQANRDILSKLQTCKIDVSIVNSNFNFFIFTFSHFFKLQIWFL